MFTLTAFDRAKYRLSRLSYGLATWRGYDARRLAAASSATGQTSLVVSCRFPPGFRGPHAVAGWEHVRVFVDGNRMQFDDIGGRWSQTCDVTPGEVPIRVEHDGPPPSFETTITIEDGQTLLLEIMPKTKSPIFGHAAPRLRVWSGDDQLEAEHSL